MLNGQTFSSRTGKTSGLPKFELLAGSILRHVSGPHTSWLGNHVSRGPGFFEIIFSWFFFCPL